MGAVWSKIVRCLVADAATDRLCHTEWNFINGLQQLNSALCGRSKVFSSTVSSSRRPSLGSKTSLLEVIGLALIMLVLKTENLADMAKRFAQKVPGKS